MMEPVCSEEKVSVEAVKMMADQRTAGHQDQSRRTGGRFWRRGWTSERLGAGRGLRQGWLGKLL